MHKNIIKQIFQNLSSAECSICKIPAEPMTMKNIQVTICGHVFHKKCMNEYVEESDKNECPLCRESQEPIEKNTTVIHNVDEVINDAIKNNNTEVLKLIIKNNHANKIYTDYDDIYIGDDKIPALSFAAKKGYYEMTNYLLSWCNSHSHIDALLSVIDNNTKMARLILENLYYDDMDDVDDYEDHTLFKLGEIGNFELIKIALGKSIGCECYRKNRNRIIHGCIENNHDDIAKQIMNF